MSKKTEMEIVDGLIEGCKTQPLPQDPLWQCFLESSQSVHPGVTLHPPPSTGLDGAKLHCCSKANTSTCRSVSHFLLLKPVENSILINDLKSNICYISVLCRLEFRKYKIFHSFIWQIFSEHHVYSSSSTTLSFAVSLSVVSLNSGLTMIWKYYKYLQMLSLNIKFSIELSSNHGKK